MQKGFRIFSLGLLIGAFLIGGVWGLVAFFLGGSPVTPSGESTTQTAGSMFSGRTSGEADGAGDGLKTYENLRYHFSLKYPSDLAVARYEEGGNSETSTFQGDGNTGFQIFVTPFNGSELTNERIKQDIPSAVIKDPREIVVGADIRALLFESADPLIGPTREVWFFRNGFLYEVTAPLALDAWLAEILETWKFLE